MVDTPAENVKLIVDGKTFELPVITGTEKEKAIDISNLRKDTGYITLDNGYANTGSCKSAITFLDGEVGILRYRGIPIEQIAENSTFLETSYLLIYGDLPTKTQLTNFSKSFTKHAAIHKDMEKFFEGYPATGHPMGILSAMVVSLGAYYPELIKPEPSKEEIDLIAVELLAKVRTICAHSYKKSIGKPLVGPRDDLQYIPNFLHMMFSTKTKDYKIVPEMVDALQTVLILHADHEQNCSTSTVRMVGSSWANLFASVSAGICALWGPLHGGANQEVIEMLEVIQKDGGNIQKYINKAKDSNDNYRLMGFGHRVYKNYDPRAKIIKKRAHDLLKKLGIKDPLLDLAVTLEDAVLKDDYFQQRKLYPNVDFYSGIIYRAIGIPTKMFPAMFAIGRMPGWIANWKEMKESSETRIGRPRQIYTGRLTRDYVPMNNR
ncbi:MAG: citrate synthase [Candidatus Omnitrophica bacterium]|nr:citrate synthase [Candidatus Omnitrophota bacterium]